MLDRVESKVAAALVISIAVFTVGCGGDAGAGKGGTGGVATGGNAGSGGGGSGGGGSGGGGSGGTASGGGGAPAGGAGGASSQSPALGGCEMFPPGDEWNMDVSGATVDAGWTQKLMTFVGSGLKLHPDFGGSQYGIPINIVPASQPPLDVVFDDYPSESDPGPYPFPSPTSAQIEGGTPSSCSGDCHLLTLQQGSCKLYEGFVCQFTNKWHCANGAVWDLTKLSYGQRPKTWTSADAAGLSITAGLLRFDEVMAHSVRHAVRFTTKCTIGKFVKPATHKAVPGSCNPNDANAPPMGLRVRMKASFDDSALSAEGKAVTAGFKKYGMIIADNGSNFYFQGERNAGWPDSFVSELKSLPASAFEVVAVPPLE
jgi:hypothetical protein